MIEAPPDRTLAERFQAETKQSLEELNGAQFRSDQSFIARFMMWTFGLSIGATILAMTVAPLITQEWKVLVPSPLEVIKIAVVPMFTLVLGYYFAKSGR